MAALRQILKVAAAKNVGILNDGAETPDRKGGGAETPDRKGEEDMDQFDMNGEDLAFGSQNEDTGISHVSVHQRLISPALLTVRNSSTDDTRRNKRRKGKTPSGKFDDQWETETEESIEPYQEQEPLEKHPDNKNPVTGEINGPKGPEPTRYGDWERKGRVTDF